MVAQTEADGGGGVGGQVILPLHLEHQASIYQKGPPRWYDLRDQDMECTGKPQRSL